MSLDTWFEVTEMVEECATCGEEIAKGEKVIGVMTHHWVGGNVVRFEELFYHPQCFKDSCGFQGEPRTVREWRKLFRQKRVEDCGHTYRRM